MEIEAVKNERVVPIVRERGKTAMRITRSRGFDNE
jgi:hypothetical protein